MSDIKEVAEELVSLSDEAVEKLKRAMADIIPETDDEIRFRREQEKLRIRFSNRRK